MSLGGTGLQGQTAGSPPVKYWSAPLYFDLPRPADADARAKASAERLATDPPGSLVFVGIAPCRLVDTRPGSSFTGVFGPPSIPGGTARTIPIWGQCGVPPGIALAYSLNFTVSPPSPGAPLSFMTVYPSGTPRPGTSLLNDPMGLVLANAAVVPASATGAIDVYMAQTYDLILDINGYYAPQSGLTLAAGSAAAPSLSFSGDSGTGIFSSGPQTLNISTGGTSRLTVESNGDVDIPGTILKNGQKFIHDLGSNTTALGIGALNLITTGSNNPAVGNIALSGDTTGSNNTAMGSHALQQNVGGDQNTAFGTATLQNQMSGFGNTAIGSFSMASGAIGPFGNNNTAVGQASLNNLTSGHENTGLGVAALSQNSTGIENTAVGENALTLNVSGNDNTAVGKGALAGVTTGGNNIAIGASAGGGVVAGSNNIFLGASPGGDLNGTMILGGGGIASTLIAGIFGSDLGGGGTAVFINSNGQLGSMNSSRRFKQDIQDIGERSHDLMKLHPVAFHYKSFPNDPLEYGLIAEEVAQIYPDLVLRNKEGQIQTVQYHKLTPMLLNELQAQEATIEQQKDQMRKQQDEIRTLTERLAAIEALLANRPAGQR
jgi:hypothetical protein